MNKLASPLVALALAVTAAGMPRAQPAAERFDYLVREDMFRGYAGDRAALERAMALCEARLAQDPDHAEALVWHGNGLLFLAGEAFRFGEHEKGTAFAQKAVIEMDRAVALRPDDVGILVARGAGMLAAGMRLPDARGRALVETAVGDFERVLALQQPYFPSLARHPKGELLAALAEGWSRLGDARKSRGYLARMVEELPGTPYAAAAVTRLDDLSATTRITCLGCHAR
jgi:hypothetical protein